MHAVDGQFANITPMSKWSGEEGVKMYAHCFKIISTTINHQTVQLHQHSKVTHTPPARYSTSEWIKWIFTCWKSRI